MPNKEKLELWKPHGVFGAIQKHPALNENLWMVSFPNEDASIILHHGPKELNKARAEWIAQQLTLALFKEQNPGLEVPIPVNEDQAKLMVLVGHGWLKDHEVILEGQEVSP